MFQRGGGRVAIVFLQAGRIRPRLEDITGLHVHVLLHRFPAELALEQVNEIHQLNG